jgi:hypothetical protein
MRAVITLDDQEGEVGMTLFLEGGFQKDSPAHQTASMIVNHLDKMASAREPGEVKWVDGEAAAWISDEIVAIPEADDTQKRVAALADVVVTPAAELQG